MKRLLTCCLALAAALPAALTGGCELLSPTDAAIEHYVRGQMAMERQDYELALAELAEAVRRDPELSLAHAAIGDIRRKQGNYAGAAAAYVQACRSNPYAFRPHYNLGVTYQFLANAAKTAETAGKFLRKAVVVYLRAVTLKPGDFDANLNLSACYFQEGKYDLAEQYCLAAIRINPKNPFAHSNLGVIYDAQNRPYDAIRAYKASLELDVHQPKLLMNLGSTYLRLRRVKDALRAFELAAKEAPDSSAPWEQIGACYYHQKRWDEALAAYREALRRNPRSAAAHRGVGVVYMTRFVLEGRDPDLREKALDAWNRSLELDSNQPDLLRLVRKYTPAPALPQL